MSVLKQKVKGVAKPITLEVQSSPIEVREVEGNIPDYIPKATTEQYGLVKLDDIYPIGSIYISIGNVKPNFGTWEKLATGKTLWNDTNADGREIEAGLPNITSNGSASAGMFSYRTHKEYSADSGAFSFTGAVNGENTVPTNWTEGGSSNRPIIFDFDASRSSAIYGKSNTVQPPSIAVSMWKRVA